MLSVGVHVFTSPKRYSISIRKRLISIDFRSFFIFLPVVLLFGGGALYLYYFDNRLFNHQDLAFYGRLGASLHNSGLEVTNPEALFYGNYKANIYHYFNEWMIALLMNCSSFSSLKILQLIVIPYLSSLIFLGGLNIANDYLKERHFYEKMLLALVFVATPNLLSLVIYGLKGMFLEMPYSILHGGIVTLKVKIVSILLLLFFKDKSKNFVEKDLLAFSLIPLFWNTLIPAFVGAYVMLLMYWLVNKHKFSALLLLKLSLPILFIPIYLKVANTFYFVSDPTFTSIPRLSLISYLFEVFSDRSYLLNTVFYVIPIAVVTLLLIFFYDNLIVYINDKIRGVKIGDALTVLVIVFLVLSALFSFLLMRELFNARQVLMNLFYPLFTIIVLFSLMKLYLRQQRTLKLIITVLLCFVVVHAYIFRSEISPCDDVIAIVEAMPDTERVASDVNLLRKPFSLYYKPLADLLSYNECFKPIRLDCVISQDELSLKETLEYQGSVSKQIFYRYVKSRGDKSVSNELKMRFLKEFDVSYLMIDKEMLEEKSSYVKNLSVDTVFVLDKDILLLKLL